MQCLQWFRSMSEKCFNSRKIEIENAIMLPNGIYFSQLEALLSIRLFTQALAPTTKARLSKVIRTNRFLIRRQNENKTV